LVRLEPLEKSKQFSKSPGKLNDTSNQLSDDALRQNVKNTATIMKI